MKTTSWICDSCGGKIGNVTDGWVEWLTRKGTTPGERIGRGLRLVHHSPAARKLGLRCQYDQSQEYARDKSLVHDLHLKDLLGPDGLTWLLSLIAQKELPVDAVVELIKRLHIPGYENARPHFEAAISEGVFEPNMFPGFYFQSQINATLEYADNEEE